jgi:hypothetical protein
MRPVGLGRGFVGERPADWTSAFVEEDNCLRAVVEVELGEDAGDVGLDGGVGDDELAGSVAVGEPAGV